MEPKELFTICPICGEDLERDGNVYTCPACDSVFSHDDLIGWEDEDESEEEDMFWV